MQLDNLELETEELLSKLRQQHRVISLHDYITLYIETQWSRYNKHIANQDYKICFKILQHLQRVLGQSLKRTGVELTGYYSPLRDMLLIILDENRQYTLQDKQYILKYQPQVAKKSLELFEQEVETNLQYFQDYLFTLINCINNLGMILILRNKHTKGLCYLFRAIMARCMHISSQQCIFQIGIIETNIAVAYRQMNQYDDAIQMLNKSIIDLELHEDTLNKSKYVLSNYALLNLTEYFILSKNTIKLAPPQEIPRVQVVYTLILSYYYYYQLLEQIDKKQESSICLQHYQQLYTQYSKLNPNHIIQQPNTNTTNSPLPEMTEEIRQLQQDHIKQDKESRHMVDRLIPGDKIMHYSYLEGGSIKVVFTLLAIQQCIEILIYSVELRIKQKVYISCASIKTLKFDFEFLDADQYQLIKDLISISKDNLIKIDKLKSYETIEGCVKSFQYSK